MAITLTLTKGYVAIIDDEDAHLAIPKWHAWVDGHYGVYATRTIRHNGRKRVLQLHREVLGITDPKIQVDHVNGDRLDCRRSNLRTATCAQNQWNTGPNRANTSGFKGVSRSGKTRWVAVIGAHGTGHRLGTFATAEEAARAWDAAARRLHGDFAYQNFPSTTPPAATETTTLANQERPGIDRYGTSFGLSVGPHGPAGRCSNPVCAKCHPGSAAGAATKEET